MSSGFNLGGQQAEADPLLGDAFFETSQYKAIASRDDRRCFIIGRTGSGKSALLRRLQISYPEHVIRITPEDLSLTYVADLQSVRWLSGEGVHLDPLFIALWKHVLLVEIIRHRYDVDSPVAKQNFLASLTDRIKRDRSKAEALRYLDDFQGKFWCEADERVREIADKFESQINSELGASVGGLRPSIGASAQRTTENRTELVSRYQRIVNETQLPRLNQMIKVLDEDILDSAQNFTFVVIDDLDQDWVDDAVANALIRCLFRAVSDLQRVDNLKVIVALRTNIFEALDFGMRTGGQEEKFRALSMRIRWSEHELERMLDERARAASATGGHHVDFIRDMLPASNKTRGDALAYILRRTLLRPRDVIAYFNECLEGAVGKPRLTWDRIHAAEPAYSRNRRLALRDEWKPTFPGIDSLFAAFEGKSSRLTRKELAVILDDVAMLVTDANFPGTTWLAKITSEIWNPSPTSWNDQYMGLIRLLFDVGFIGCSKSGPRKPIYSNDDPDYLDRPSKLDAVVSFSIHPAFRDALDLVDA